MGANAARVLIDPASLHAMRGDPRLRIVDLGAAERFAERHLPGAVHLDFARLNEQRGEAGGLFPAPGALAVALGEAGIGPDSFVVACDDTGGGRAGRLVWALRVLGHDAAALLDGGIAAWAAHGLGFESGAAEVAPRRFPVREPGPALATRADVLAAIGDPGVVLLDTRSPAEFAGEDVRAARGGHVPGAVNYDWVRAKDPDGRVRPLADIAAELAELGVTPDREVIAYCQTHHRSSHTWVVLDALGFARARGYAGAWSEWGNDPALPVET